MSTYARDTQGVVHRFRSRAAFVGGEPSLCGQARGGTLLSSTLLPGAAAQVCAACAAIKLPLGFATMSKERVKELARHGGHIAHALGTAHEFKEGSEEARAAGAKGGAATAHRREG